MIFVFHLIHNQNKRWGEKEELSSEEKRMVLNIFERGNSRSEISQLLQRSYSTVSSFIRRYYFRGEIENRRRSDRPKKKKLTTREYRKLKRLVKVNRRHTLADIAGKINQTIQIQLPKVLYSFIYSKMALNEELPGKRMVIKKVNRKKWLS